VIVAACLVAAMKVARNEIIRVIAMWYRFVTAAGTVRVAGGVPRARVRSRAGGGVRTSHVNCVLGDVTIVHVVQVPIVQKIDVVGMSHARVCAVRGAVGMAVIGVTCMFHTP
jgi:hypothetical protein